MPPEAPRQQERATTLQPAITRPLATGPATTILLMAGKAHPTHLYHEWVSVDLGPKLVGSTHPRSDGVLRVIYIAGISHTGSTLLGHMLGELEGAAYCGEICHTWKRGILENRVCTCGATFRDCLFWSAVVEQLPVDTDEKAAALASTHRRVTHFRERAAAPLRRSVEAKRREFEDYAHATLDLYQGVATVAETRLVIDSSKSPLHARFLDDLPGVDVGVVHLVRDPSATAHSFRRRKQLGYTGVFTRSLRWLTWNLTCERLARRLPYVRVRYEDLIARPAEAIERITRALELPFTPPRFEGSAVDLTPKHIFSGNRARGESGLVALRRDDEWREQLPAGMRAVTRATTLPRLARYGYGREWREAVSRG